LVSFIISLNETGAFIIENTFEMDPNREKYNEAEADN
jgi:hypothetical protein